ncbi:hypothetical protein NDU88_001075 [Pleurodeles waltl]|uniref:Uncharacterized protein n=1 Tax=Pleurodeles waltl TaxID=8319 RepID=A0AAV7KNI2_PLEWA|nr:hypothetical protein NDU88_001075 [Pleurodeles waltl]
MHAEDRVSPSSQSTLREQASGRHTLNSRGAGAFFLTLPLSAPARQQAQLHEGGSVVGGLPHLLESHPLLRIATRQ